ncbi:hypothetical protein [Sodalis sp. (in: enterobacteria)]
MEKTLAAPNRYHATGVKMDNYHVTKAEDKWVLTKEGNSRAS